ncbi:MAG: hypothetical protein QOG03_2188 [Actinomycetota bacterium]|jgi:uncharacterized protein YukE|nr:hypothetical protein [Actinomycetota bacterium]
MASSAELYAAAARLDSEAGGLPGALDDVVRAATPDAWMGPAASRFDGELTMNRGRLRQSADDLRDTARRLRAQAALVRADELAAACPRPAPAGPSRVC